MIRVSNLHKSFGKNNVLKGIDEHIEKGEVVVVIGPSGSGKSTFLRCLNLLESPTSGKIVFEGNDITDKGTDINKIREKMGMVFQQFNLFPHKTVLQNLTIAPIKVKGLSKQEAEKKAMELLNRVGLADKAEAYPSSLSGGQKQRIAIARMLVDESNVIIFDDSLSALDTKTDLMIRTALKKKRKDQTMIIITHRSTTAKEADKIIVLDQGSVSQIGRHEELVLQDGLYKELWGIQGELEEEFQTIVKEGN